MSLLHTCTHKICFYLYALTYHTCFVSTPQTCCLYISDVFCFLFFFFLSLCTSIHHVFSLYTNLRLRHVSTFLHLRHVYVPTPLQPRVFCVLSLHIKCLCWHLCTRDTLFDSTLLQLRLGFWSDLIWRATELSQVVLVLMSCMADFVLFTTQNVLKLTTYLFKYKLTNVPWCTAKTV